MATRETNVSIESSKDAGMLMPGGDEVASLSLACMPTPLRNHPVA
jgi:hypothetical protein